MEIKVSLACVIALAGLLCQVPGIHGSCSICHNGGTEYNNLTHFFCACDTGFVGSRCETDCSTLCNTFDVNHMDCVHTLDGPQCVCKTPYYGENCQNICGTSDCLNGASCVTTGTTFQCECLPGFYGDHCQHPSPVCTEDSCNGRGTCEIIGQETLKCTCSRPFHGSTCQECSNYLGCQGRGTCHPASSGYSWECKDCIHPFYGWKCSKKFPSYGYRFPFPSYRGNYYSNQQYWR